MHFSHLDNFLSVFLCFKPSQEVRGFYPLENSELSLIETTGFKSAFCEILMNIVQLNLTALIAFAPWNEILFLYK